MNVKFHYPSKEEVPILLSTNFENVISAENLIILEKHNNFENLKKFNKTFFLFEGENIEALTKARTFWKEVSVLKTDFNSKFYEQSAEKKWSLKA